MSTVKLIPKQISLYWEMIRFVIKQGFVARETCTHDHLQKCLADMLSGKVQCWMVFTKTAAETNFYGFALTRLAHEEYLGERILAIDNIYAFKPMPAELFEEAFLTIEKFAISNKCRTITALTDFDKVKHLAERFGFSTRTYLFKEV